MVVKERGQAGSGWQWTWMEEEGFSDRRDVSKSR